MWFKTPIGEEQATQAVLDPVVGKSHIHYHFHCTYHFVVVVFESKDSSVDSPLVG